MSYDDSSSDSDSSLPDISHLFNESTADNPISSGDIVFAKYRKLYWPALVRTVYPKEKKICIWFCDQPGKNFKLPLKSICRLSDRKKIIEIEKDIKEAGCSSAHENLTIHAKRYIKRRLEGCEDDPLKFFDQTYPFFLIENILKLDPNADVSGLKIPPIYTSVEDKNYVIQRVSKDESDNSEVISMNSEGEISIDGEEETSNVKPVDSRSNEIFNLWKTTSDLALTAYADKLVEFIKSGRADKRLQAILSKSAPSEFYNIFERASECGKRDFISVSYTGPVQDSIKINELTAYLLSLFQKFTARQSVKTRNGMKKKYFLNGTKDVAHYVASVWLPESIIYAMAKIENISICQAKKLFKEEKIKSSNAAQDTPAEKIDLSGNMYEKNKNNSQQIKNEVKHSFSLKRLSEDSYRCDELKDNKIQKVNNASKFKSNTKYERKSACKIFETVNGKKCESNKIIEKFDSNNNNASKQKICKKRKKNSKRAKV